ncbi:MAG: TetR/AcrR family transcriptional regulator [Thermoanaerobaculia bacterium]
MGRPPIIDRNTLLETAREQFARKGYRSTTLADIATRMGVTPAALLRHVKSKEKLFVESMRAGRQELPDFIVELEATPGDADPREVLERFAKAFVPYVQSKMDENISVYTGSRSGAVRGASRLKKGESGPARALTVLEGYIRRAARAGRLTVNNAGDAALSLIASLHGYVYFHQVLHVVEHPMKLRRYVGTVLDIWGSASFTPKKKAGAAKSGSNRRSPSKGPDRQSSRGRSGNAQST